MAHVTRRLARRFGILTFAVTAALAACIDLESIAPESKGNDPSATEAHVSIDLDRDSIAHAVRKQYTARVQTAYGEIKYLPVTWHSTNPDVVQITTDGLATAVGAGSAQLVASIPGDADTLEVTVHGYISTFAVLPEVVQILQGDTLTFEATFGQQQGTPSLVQWLTSDTSKALVDENGTLSAIDVGDLELTAMYGAKRANAQVRVVPAPVASIAIRPEAASLQPGQTASLSAQLRDAVGRPLHDREVTWTSSDPAVATVSTDGVVTGKAKGVVLITAQSEGVEATASVSVSARSVSFVAVSLEQEQLVAGEKTQATAQVLDASGAAIPPHEQPVTWQSTNSSLATVDAAGLVTAVAPGSVTIRAFSGGKTGSIALSITAATAASVAILPPNVTLSPSSQAQLTGEVRDQKGNPIPGVPLSWEIDNPAVASVSASGLVTAKQTGTAKVTARSNSLSATSTLTVTQTPVASVAVAPSSVSLDIGQEQSVNATVYDNGGNVLEGRGVSWSSSNSTVASVSAAGVVKGLAAGSATITAVSEGKTALVQVTVKASQTAPVPVEAIAVSLSALQLNPGQSAQASAVLYDADGKVLTGRTVTWSSSAPSLATVSASGAVTAVAAGTVTIIATSEGQKGMATLTVNQPTAAPVASVSVSLAPTAVVGGGKATATVVLKDAQGHVLTGRTIGFSSSNQSVAVVSSSGTVTGVATGTATIKATSEGKNGIASLTVTSGVVLVASVELSASTTSLSAGQQVQVTATARDAQGNVLTGRDISWSSSNTSVATVSGGGMVTAKAGGSTTISAVSGSGAVGTLGLTVQGGSTTTTAPVATVTVSLGSASLSTGQTTQAAVVLKDGTGNVLTGRSVAWSSSNTSVATVSPSGLVTAVAAGSASIRALSEGKQGSASLTVTTAGPTTPPPPPPSGVTIATLMGPIGSASATSALGGIWAKYESDFVKYDEAQWTNTCSTTPDLINSNCNYYDRAMIYYVWWQRTGQTKYRDRANELAVRFRKEYLEKTGYVIATHMAMMDGIAIHYLITGDPASLTAVGKVADYMAYTTVNPYVGFGDPNKADNRVQAYAIKSLLLAYMLKAPSVGLKPQGIGGNRDWAMELRSALDKILGTRDPDGQWRGAKCGTAGRATHPFTIGLLYDALIRYYEEFEKDPRILPAIRQSADVLWQNDWIPTAQAFKYVGISCPGEGGPTPAPDLNNLIVNGYAWTYHMTGNVGYQQKADEIFIGSVSKNSPSSGPKQFNQSYTSSYRYLSWR